MRIVAPCVQCAAQHKLADVKQLELTSGELDDSGVIYIECPRGHKSAVIYDMRRYEVLLRSGAKALIYGFPNEAIASLSGALERAYEFYVRVICCHKGIDHEQVRKAWKSVDAQSERQLGAFNFVFLLQEGISIELDPAIPEIRNKIVHKGRMAKERDAHKFGDLVFQRIRCIEKAMAPYEEATKRECDRELAAMEGSIPAGMQSGTLKTMSVMAAGGKVTGHIEKFSDYLMALKSGIEKGLA